PRNLERRTAGGEHRREAARDDAPRNEEERRARDRRPGRSLAPEPPVEPAERERTRDQLGERVERSGDRRLEDGGLAADQESADRDRRVGEEAEEPEARRDRPRRGNRRGLDLPFYFPSIESHAPILRAGPMRRKAAGRAFAAVRAPRSAARRPPLSPCSEAGACSWATAAIARSTSCPRRNRKMKDQVRNR